MFFYTFRDLKLSNSLLTVNSVKIINSNLLVFLVFIHY